MNRSRRRTDESLHAPISATTSRLSMYVWIAALRGRRSSLSPIAKNGVSPRCEGEVRVKL